MNAPNPTYLLKNDAGELARIQLQSRTWEPAGAELLATLGKGAGLRAVDVGCGAMGWLRLLSRWVGGDGEVVGTDLDEAMLARASELVAAESLTNVTLHRDDLFDSKLEAAHFDLVHARFQLAPLGRFEAQLAAYARLTKPGGWMVLEEPDAASWRSHPDAPSAGRLVQLILQAFAVGGGDFEVGRRLPTLLRPYVERVSICTHVLPLADGHPYARLPIQFAGSLRPRLSTMVDAVTLDELIAQAELELAQADRWSTSFTLVQAYGQTLRRPALSPGA